MNVLASLEGPSWTQCEDIDLKDLEAENGLEILLRRLDSKWKYDERVELGSIFDTFFFKVQRKPNQSLLEYVTDFHQALRDVQRLNVNLPEKNHWMAHVAPRSFDQGPAAPRAVPGC